MPTKSNAILSSHRDAATRVSTYLSEQHGIKLTPITALEVIARALGAVNWQTLKSMAEQGRAPRIGDAGIWGDPRELPPVGPGSLLKDLHPNDDAPAALHMRHVEPADVGSLGANRVREYIRLALTSRCQSRKQRPVEDIEAALEAVEQALGLSLTPMQQEAVRSVFQYPLSSISGESGTGKATIMRALLPLADKLGLVAYPARAKFTPTGADLARLQECDLLILREDVIRDTPLLQFLLEHAPITCRVVFFGDMPGVAPKEQHEAIRELIERGVVHALRMVQKFRQSKAVPAGAAGVVRITRLTPPAPLMLKEFSSPGARYDRLNPPAEEYVMHGVFNNGTTAPTQSLNVSSYIYEARGFRTSDRSGKWCIVRDAASVDALWAKIQAAVVAGELPAAMVSSPAAARQFGGTYLICVFTPEWRDREEVMRVRQLLRDLGVAEELGYKRDVETVYGVYGTPDEWFYRA